MEGNKNVHLTYLMFYFSHNQAKKKKKSDVALSICIKVNFPFHSDIFENTLLNLI